MTALLEAKTRGERIELAISRAGETKGSVAKKIGKTRQTVDLWIKGESVPGSDNLAAVCRVCRVSMDWVETGVEAPTGRAVSGTEITRFAAWSEFLGTRVGRRTSDEALQFLSSIVVPKGKKPTSDLLEELALGLAEVGLVEAEGFRDDEPAFAPSDSEVRARGDVPFVDFVDNPGHGDPEPS